MELDLAAIHEALAAELGDRPCLVWHDQTWSWAQVTERTRRLANVFVDHGITRIRALDECEGWESPHHHVGLYLQNSNAYLEAQLAAAKAGAAAFNVNYRYVADELAYLFLDASASAIVYQGCFAATLADVLPRLPHQPLLLRVDDGSGDELLTGALDYEEALAAASPDPTGVATSGDDLYVLYTGGTTGNPKGVLWRQADFLVAALGVRRKDGSDYESLDELVGPATRRNLATLPAPPLMHGAAMWNALSTWINGGTIVIQDRVDRMDPADILDTCERHGVTSLLIVGDAFARPLIDEQRARPRDLTALRFSLTGGPILSPSLRADLLAMLPQLRIVDVLGSSESGRQAVASSVSGDEVGPTRFAPSSTAAVLDDQLTTRLEAGSSEIGWLAQSGRIPRGYLGDPVKTEATFPTIDGERWSVPGDRAALRADGTVELHGRESVTINTGGEKVFAEEVEQVLKHHPAVYDVLVVGRPSPTWGQEVVAVIALAEGQSVTLEELHRGGQRAPRRVQAAEGPDRGAIDLAVAIGQARLRLGPNGRHGRLTATPVGRGGGKVIGATTVAGPAEHTFARGHPMIERTVPLPFPIDLPRTFWGIRRGQHDPTCRFDGAEIWRASRSPAGPSTVRLIAGADRIEATAWGDGAEAALDAIPSLVGCHDDSTDFEPTHPVVQKLWRDFADVRVPRSGAVTEALVNVVLEQRVTTFEARRAQSQLVTRYSEPAPGPVDLFLPPDPEVLAGIAYYDLHVIGVERKRADTVRRVAASARRLDALALLPAAEAHQRLLHIAGVGPWSAAEVALVALGDADAVPVGDAHLPAIVTFALTGDAMDDDDAMLEVLESFAGHRGRVIRLIAAAGISPPKHGPRYAPRDVRDQ